MIIIIMVIVTVIFNIIFSLQKKVDTFSGTKTSDIVDALFL